MARRKSMNAENAPRDGKINTDHAQIIRSRIINSAKELLAQEGYSKTTIRRIVKHSGVLTGSIYYFFRNKEDIFRAILLEVMHGCIEKVAERCNEESPLFQYAAVCQVELMVVADNMIARETYKNAYDSATIFEGMIAQYQEMAKSLFKGTKYELPEEEYYQKTLLIKGAMHACLSEMFFDRPTNFDRSRESLLKLVLNLFGAGKEESEAIIKKLAANSKALEEVGIDLLTRPL